MSATIGQRVWFLDADAQRGPFPATVIRAGEPALLSIEFPEGVARVEATYWLTEDGTTTSWFEIPADGQVPSNIFE